MPVLALKLNFVDDLIVLTEVHLENQRCVLRPHQTTLETVTLQDQVDRLPIVLVPPPEHLTEVCQKFGRGRKSFHDLLDLALLDHVAVLGADMKDYILISFEFHNERALWCHVWGCNCFRF
jgi:hypothetical protein